MSTSTEIDRVIKGFYCSSPSYNNTVHVLHALHKGSQGGVAVLLPGPRLNIKTVLSTYGDFHVKDKMAVRTSYL